MHPEMFKELYKCIFSKESTDTLIFYSFYRNFSQSDKKNHWVSIFTSKVAIFASFWAILILKTLIN